MAITFADIYEYSQTPSKIFQASLKSYDASDDRPMKFNSMQKSYDTNRKSITGGQRPGHGG